MGQRTNHLLEHDLFRKPEPTFRDHALEHDLFRKPEPTFRDHALEHDLFRKPERTLRDHTLTIMPAGEARDGAPVLLVRPAAARLPRSCRSAPLLVPGLIVPGS